MQVEEAVDQLRGGPDPARWSAALDRTAVLVGHFWNPGYGTLPHRDWGLRLGALISYSVAVTGGPEPGMQTPQVLLEWWEQHGAAGIGYALVGSGHRIDGVTMDQAAEHGPAAVWCAGIHEHPLQMIDAYFSSDIQTGPCLLIGQWWITRALRTHASAGSGLAR